MEDRIARLESENRWMKRAGGGLLVLVAAIVAMGQTEKPFEEEMRVRNLILVDETGVSRGKITSSGASWMAPGSAARVALYVDPSDGAGLSLSLGSRTVAAGVNEFGATLAAHFGGRAAVTSVTEFGASHRLEADETKASTELILVGNESGLSIHDKAGDLRAYLGALELKDPKTGEVTKYAESTLLLFDKEGKVLEKLPR